MKMTARMCFILALLCMGAERSVADGHDHYRYDGREIELTELPGNNRAFIVPESQMKAILDIANRSMSFGSDKDGSDVRIIKPRDGYGALLIRNVDDAESRELAAEASAGDTLSPAGLEIPVYQVDGTIMLPTKTASVEFNLEEINKTADVEPDKYAREILVAEFGSTPIRDESRPDRLRYEISFRGWPMEKALPKINALDQRPDVLAAWPNFNRIIPNPIDTDTEAEDVGTEPQALIPPASGGVGIGNVCTPSPTSNTPDDPMFDELWPLHNTGPVDPATGECTTSSTVADGYCDVDIDWLEAWNRTQGVVAPVEPTIAVLDVGIQQHEDLDLVIPGIDATVDENQLSGSWEPLYHGQDHGTLVAGVAGAIVNNGIGVTGAATKARLLSVRIAAYGTHGDWNLGQGVAEDGVKRAVDAGARVLNNSWWSGSVDPGVAIELQTSATQADALFVVAAGNLNSDFGCAWSSADNEYQCPSPSVRFPATLTMHSNRCVRDRVIAVSGTNQRDEFKTLENYENRPSYQGDTTVGMSDWGSAHADAVSLAAPGELRCTTDTDGQNSISNKYSFMYQTSSAAPIVSGAAATILRMNPEATAPQVKRWMLTTTSNETTQPNNPLTGRPIPDPYFGHGRLNLNDALTRANIEMNMLRPVAPAAGIILLVERSHRRVGFRQSRHVIAKVMQLDGSGQLKPVVNEQVKFNSRGWFGWAPFKLLTPGILRTDCDGIAEARIQGNSWIYWTGTLTASSGGDSDSEQITVGNWIFWLAPLGGATILIWIFIRLRRPHP